MLASVSGPFKKCESLSNTCCHSLPTNGLVRPRRLVAERHMSGCSEDSSARASWLGNVTQGFWDYSMALTCRMTSAGVSMELRLESLLFKYRSAAQQRSCAPRRIA